MLKSEASARGMTGLSTTEELKRAFSQISQFAGIYNILENVIVDGGRAMAQAVLQVDDAMTDLQMATGVVSTTGCWTHVHLCRFRARVKSDYG